MRLRVLLEQVIFSVFLSALSVSVFANGLDSLRSQRLQTAFAYQFLKFISWEPSLQRERFVFCVLSDNAQLLGQLQTLNNKSTLWGEIDVLHFDAPPSVGQFATCQGAYIDTGFYYHPLQSLILNGEVLTIVKEDVGRKELGVFEFLMRDNKLRFRVNLKQARSKGIQVSASLLLLAVEVIEN